MSTLLCGAETWTTKACHLRKLNTFHHHCVRSIVGISRRQQWVSRITSDKLAATLGVEADLVTAIRGHRLRWLGHVARMDDNRMPKRVLFGELQARRPPHSPKRRWRDVVLNNLSQLQLQSSWFTACQDRLAWRRIISADLPQPATPEPFLCRCGRVFRRSGDLKRHSNFCKI